MNPDSLSQQLALETQPYRPRDTRLLPGNVPVAEPMHVHEVLGYLKAHLKRGHQNARVALRQSFQLVQPLTEDA